MRGKPRIYNSRLPISHSQQMQLIDIGANLTHESFERDLDAVLERARAAGFAHYLVKPVDPARLLALMAAFGADAGPAQRQSPDDSAMAPLS